MDQLVQQSTDYAHMLHALGPLLRVGALQYHYQLNSYLLKNEMLQRVVFHYADTIISTYRSACLHVYTIHTCIHKYIHMHTCIHTHTHTHTHTQICQSYSRMWNQS
jgi:hypothetical protein